MLAPQTIMAMVIALAGFGSAWTLQDWRYGAKEAHRAQQELADTRNNAAATLRRAENVIAAQNSAQSRAVALRRDADSARSELERLRNDLAHTTPSATTTPQACTERTIALSDVLGECAATYSDLAGKADRHANDVQTLMEGWPVQVNADLAKEGK